MLLLHAEAAARELIVVICSVTEVVAPPKKTYGVCSDDFDHSNLG